MILREHVLDSIIGELIIQITKASLNKTYNYRCSLIATECYHRFRVRHIMIITETAHYRCFNGQNRCIGCCYRCTSTGTDRHNRCICFVSSAQYRCSAPVLALRTGAYEGHYRDISIFSYSTMLTSIKKIMIFLSTILSIIFPSTFYQSYIKF